MISAVIFDLFGTLIHLPRDTKPYFQLCRAIDDSSRIRESLVVDAPTLADFCDHIGAAHPPNLAEIQRNLDSDISQDLFSLTLCLLYARFVVAGFALLWYRTLRRRTSAR